MGLSIIAMCSLAALASRCHARPRGVGHYYIGFVGISASEDKLRARDLGLHVDPVSVRALHNVAAAGEDDP